MADLCTIYCVDTEDNTRRTLWEVSQQKQLRLETFSRGADFLKAFDHGPGCLVAEFQIEDMNGLELQQRLAQQGSKLPVIFVAAQPETHCVVSAMQNGAITVLQKPVDASKIGDAVTKALAHELESRRIDASHARLQRRRAQLTPKENDVLELIMQGVPNKAIAKKLGISLRTVESRRQSIFQKTKCKSLADLIKLLIDTGWESKDQSASQRRR